MSDIQRFVLSYPKAGRTWLRIFFHYYFNQEDPGVIYLHKEERIVNFRDPEKQMRRILLLRNPCDIMVSYYFHETIVKRKSKKNIQNMSEFIRHPLVGVHRLKECVDQWKKCKEQFVIYYEDLFKPIWKEILLYFEFPIDEQAIKRANTAASFDNVRKNLKKLRYLPGGWRYLPLEKGIARTNPKDPNAHKFRRGKVGGYVDYLSEEDIAYVKKIMNG